MAAKEILVKKYVVRLSGEERERLETLIRKGKSPARRVLKARILLKADVSEGGKGWSDNRIIEALETSPTMPWFTERASDWWRTASRPLTPRPSFWSRTISASTARLHSTKPFRRSKPGAWSNASNRTTLQNTALARSGRVRTRRPNVPVPRSPHSRQTNPHRGNRRLGARPQCRPRQGRLAIHHQKCSHQT